MSKPDHSIDQRLLDSAKEEFLANGFEKASLKIICENAGITTGALYKRYTGKEELFNAVVAETFSALNDFVAAKTQVDEKFLSDNELIAAWDMGEPVMMGWYRFLYAQKDGFFLLIRCSAGTRYADFQHDWVDNMTGKTYNYFLEAYKRGLAHTEISRKEMHILLTAFWATIYEPFIHGYTWDEIVAHCKIVCNLFNWNRVLGFEELG